METKICTKCNNEYDATLQFWHKQKNGKYGLRSVCKICSYAAMKTYRKTPKAKEANRLQSAKWRVEHPDKALEISRNNYRLHGKEYNDKRRDKYKTDPEYRCKKIEYDRKYKESGRRYKMNCKPETREKSRFRSKKRRENKELKEHDYNRNAKWRVKNKEYLNSLHKKNRKQLCPSYVAQSMRISVLDLTPEILETKRIIIQLKRELKSNNIKIR
jgi:hypothetical protein